MAVLADWENLVVGAGVPAPGAPPTLAWGALETLADAHGGAAVRTAHANWADPRFARHLPELRTHAVQAVHTPRRGGRNGADVHLTVQAMDLLHTRPDLTVFVVATGDGDLGALFARLRAAGRRVVGTGCRANTSADVLAHCDEHHWWHDLMAKLDAPPADTAAADHARDLVAQVLARPRRGRRPRTAAWLKQQVLLLDAGFDERALGHARFRDLLAAMPTTVQVVGPCGDDVEVRAAR